VVGRRDGVLNDHVIRERIAEHVLREHAVRRSIFPPLVGIGGSETVHSAHCAYVDQVDAL
jgi:hypothetical protein